ncbi:MULTISPECIES: ABC transporter ATP-binding protein/permease [Bradyrhizobium]|uniref:ABC transporter ATP-binding protein/permease n=1 Tax=Bradyrhizobium TaxID=374 RepID=UPI00155E5842|nr:MULTISPECIES: ABC transporter ATP-binding protein/permease [Bradyrhizobium]MBR1171174.1 ABC transporter ATP-binding protein/permease [Bradyrhizobium liaoningense]MDD1520244.1 ABC transporter ATP-binding protein [Bradyrhizobium sp. WBAH30]MDD1545059.1 ABC transporter ATP-binding protein [Bradyrhizobium sp. WBAH41]MDD1558488.1 ABC transporter ATP-binding protein [Bradyrhizobium sp. WBAH23]MDD1565886.1 ABC transporter ATP-binding protein [Bradyrhizobium sp. WBAH33]
MKNISATLAIVWRIAAPYFRSEDKWAGRGLLAAVVAMELALVAIDVLVNQWQNRFYSALQNSDWDAFVTQIWIFVALASTYIALAVYKLYLNQWLQIRWRQWLTRHYLGEWLAGSTHYRMQLKGDAADNPDQRITEDVKNFVEQTLTIGLGLLSSIVTLFSFVIILWGLSNAAPLRLFGTDVMIPGYLCWGALIYAIFGTALTHWIGSPLVNLNFEQQRYEADFRFNLVRVRENSEQIALLRGEGAERARLLDRFGFVIANWYGIMSRTKRLTAFTASYQQAAVLFPYVLVAPAFFAKKIQLGDMMQTASAFSSVQGALSFFVTAYRSLAEWRSIVARLDGFEMSVASAVNLPAHEPAITLEVAGRHVDLAQLCVNLPNGTPLVAAKAFTIQASERVLVTGPSGSGKSTLFRAIAGIWPFGTGTVVIPEKAKLMMLPQRPYFPLGMLRDAVVYPAASGAFEATQVRDALIAVGLPDLAERLAEDGHWNRMLSLGEQQRLGLARALLHAPDYLFLDEATASLDEPSEARLYRLLAEKLPQATIVSIGHRSTLDAFHTRKVTLVKDGAIHVVGGERAAAEPSAAR